jgi:hypothetical protein
MSSKQGKAPYTWNTEEIKDLNEFHDRIINRVEELELYAKVTGPILIIYFGWKVLDLIFPRR